MSDVADVEVIFHAALERDGAERESYLDEACGGDDVLRDRVQTLLSAHGSAGEFLSGPAVPTPTGREAEVSEGPGDTIGPYVLRERLGEGGFGVVYRADQREPLRREVALKVIKLGMDTRQVIARFEAERQALALTDHPNIARVYDAGATTSGRPYFVMELVRGVAIHRYCDTHRLSVVERLALFIAVCRAVQHAHQKGLVHRDLKPSNVLVTVQDGRALPKVIDFGVAKATHGRLGGVTLHTELGQILGTPAYMSPEQADRSGLDVDTRTDVYSLGVLLYELLTGATPFDARRLRDAGFAEVQRILREEDPPPPSLRVQRLGEHADRIARDRCLTREGLRARLRRDLDWITLQALEKDRTRRYSTPDALATELLRHLDSQPVQAGPPSTLYVLGKFVRRNRVPVLAGGAVLLALLTGMTFAVWSLFQLRAERDLATARLAFEQDLHQYELRDLGADELVARAREVYGDDHGAVATALALSARQLQDLGRLSQAEEHLRRALVLWEERSGAGPSTALVHGQLGALLLDRGDLDEAEQHLDRAVALGRGLEPRPLSLLAEAQVDRGELLRRRGEFARAARAFELALGELRICASDQPGRLGRVYEFLAESYDAAGEPDRAAAARLEATEQLVRAFPDTVVAADQHLALGLSLRNLPGFALRARQEVAAGLELYRDHPDLQGVRYLTGLVALAEMLAGGEESDRVESEALWEEALELGTRLYGESLEYANLLMQRARALTAAGRDREAYDLQGRASEIRQRSRTLTSESVGRFIRQAGAAAVAAVVPDEVPREDWEFAGRMLDVLVGLDPLAGPLYSLPDRAARQAAHARGVGEVTDLLALSILASHLGRREWARTLLERARPLASRPRAAENRGLSRLLREAERLVDRAGAAEDG